MSLSPRRNPSLKYVLGGLAAGAIALPFALFFVVSLVLSTSAPKVPVLRLEYLSQELLSAIELGKGDSISVRPSYRPPAGLRLIIEGADQTIIYSTDELFKVGSVAKLEDVAASIRGDASVSSFFAESMIAKGREIGHYFAWFPSGARLSEARGSPVLILVLLGLVAGAFAMGVVIATQLARSVMKLERAAGRIASGDLETAVEGVGGMREIEDLASAMDGMRAALREERAQRARFLAAVSHDLRTPLTSIGGYLEAVDDGLASDPEILARYVRIMRDKTRLLEARIASLIEFAHMETGEWRMGFETVDLRYFLEALAREFREDAELMGRDFSFELSALGVFRTAVDRALLARAIENLVSNAIRYSPAGGAIRMTARSAPGFLYVDLDDEGPGIASAERERVFEAFVRGSGARDGEGSGLGLYIVRSVIQGHGWDVRAGSSPAGGGRFTIAIPNTKTAAP
jgi:two-component system, OmpR family, sensor histidine kinase BaeS